jgi:DNA-directed RNA polymerase subunit K/omega
MNIVKKEDRITNNILTKGELVMVISNRAEMISSDIKIGSHTKLFIDINNLDATKLSDPIYIAMEELKQFKLPFIIERQIGQTKKELWHLIFDKMIYIE